MYYVNRRRLYTNDASPVAITNLAIASGVTVYSGAIDVQRNVGFLTLLLKENKAGNAGSVNVWYEYSFDGTNFYIPNTTNAAVLTSDGDIVDTFGNNTQWIVQAARLGVYMRVGFLANTDSQVTADLMFQEADN